MKVVRDRADARWLPSRFNLPLFRLYALLRCATAKPEPRPGTVLAIDRHQSAMESHIVAATMYVFAVAFTSELLARALHWWAALAVAIVFVPLLLQLPLFITGNIARGSVNHWLNSATLVVAYTMVASYFATLPGWVRWVGFSFLMLLAANAVVAPIVWLLRHRIASLEAACAS
jgi:hypothetical protein